MDKDMNKKTSIKVKEIAASPVILASGCIILIFISVLLYFDSINVGSRALADAYEANYLLDKEAARKDVYDKVYNFAENEYHVSNRVNIELGDLKEKADLEVLKVNDIEYIIDDGSKNDSHANCWASFPGEAVFIVNLQAGEYIIDNARSYILVRVPAPELSNISIGTASKLLFEDDWSNGTYSQGEEMARKQMKEAQVLVTKEFLSNQFFYLNAQNSAKNQITELVKQMNPNVEELIVEVEFF